MPKAIKCLLDNATISVQEAIKLWDGAEKLQRTYPDFRCIVCNRGVRPHREGGGQAAHFEHHDRPSESWSNPVIKETKLSSKVFQWHRGGIAGPAS